MPSGLKVEVRVLYDFIRDVSQIKYDHDQVRLFTTNLFLFLQLFRVLGVSETIFDQSFSLVDMGSDVIESLSVFRI